MDEQADPLFEQLMTWPWEDNAVRRSTGLIEHVCPHGVGHPNPASVLWTAEEHRSKQFEPEEIAELEAVWSVHGCCKHDCCSHPSFPDYRSGLARSHSIIRQQHKSILEVTKNLVETEKERDKWRDTVSVLVNDAPDITAVPVEFATPRWWQFSRRRRLSEMLTPIMRDEEPLLGNPEESPTATPGHQSLADWVADQVNE